MQTFYEKPKKDLILLFSIIYLVTFSLIVIRSIAQDLFYFYLIYVFVASLVFNVILQIDIEVFKVFSKYLYILSIILLILPLVIGEVTRGAIRWIPLGPITIQPSEVVRPFLFLFFANFLLAKDLTFSHFLKAVILFIVPFFLILIQPSLGVALLTGLGFLGVLIFSNIKKKYVLLIVGLLFCVIPLFWFILAPYQKERITQFTNPFSDPHGAGYNSIQSMISVGSGRFFGRGLGEGVQTQLAFLPEKHTDFVFAAVSEELGFVGATLLLAGIFFVMIRLITIIEKANGPVERAFVAGVFFSLLGETFIHIGMNLGLLPITGVPLPLVSMGGSSLVGTMISLSMAIGCKKTSGNV